MVGTDPLVSGQHSLGRSLGLSTTIAKVTASYPGPSPPWTTDINTNHTHPTHKRQKI